MQPTIETQLNTARPQLMEALMPNGFKTTEYRSSGCNGNASLTITMVDASVKPLRTLSVTITDICDEDSVRRLVKVSYSLTETTVHNDGSVATRERLHGSANHELTAYERCKYNSGEFLTSSNGIEILSQVRICIQNRCKALDLLARADKLVQTAHLILKADKDQHRTLLDADQRQDLCKWLAKRGSLPEPKLESWINNGKKLQRKPLFVIDSQAKSAAIKERATYAQLQQLINKFAPVRSAS